MRDLEDVGWGDEDGNSSDAGLCDLVLVALVAGFGLGAIIHKAERMRKDEFLAFCFSTLENSLGRRRTDSPAVMVEQALPRFTPLTV